MIIGDPLVDKKINNTSYLKEKIVNNIGEIKEITGAFFSSKMLSNENCN